MDQRDRLAAHTMVKEGLEHADEMDECVEVVEVLYTAGRFLDNSDAPNEAAQTVGLARAIAQRTQHPDMPEEDFAWAEACEKKLGEEVWAAHLVTGGTLSIADVRSMVDAC